MFQKVMALRDVVDFVGILLLLPCILGMTGFALVKWIQERREDKRRNRIRSV